MDKYADIAAYVDKVTSGEGINLLINNAAILGKEGQRSILELKKDDFMKHLEINTVAPILLIKVVVA